MSQSCAERKQSERERRREAGLVRVEAWVRPELVARVRRYVEQLNALPDPKRKGMQANG